MKKASTTQPSNDGNGEDLPPADNMALEPLTVSYVKAAAALDVSTKTISRLVKKGEVKAIKIGTKNAVIFPSLKRYVARQAA